MRIAAEKGGTACGSSHPIEYNFTRLLFSKLEVRFVNQTEHYEPRHINLTVRSRACEFPQRKNTFTVAFEEGHRQEDHEPRVTRQGSLALLHYLLDIIY